MYWLGVRRSRRTRARVAGICALACAGLGVGGLAAAPSAAAADRLPDLGIAPLSDIKIDRAADGRRLLRFSTVIVNVGAGRFEVRGQGSSTAVQRIYNDLGLYRDVSTGAVFVWGGDGHNHWHVQNLETSELSPLDAGNPARPRTGAKWGFCFWDNVAYRLTLPGAPPSAFYGSAGCGNSTNSTIAMGLSVGWGDLYPWYLPDQYVDVTGLPPGRYRLQSTADASNWFLEGNDSNNFTWVDIQLRANGAPKILGYGPAA